ncbi:hypothetical protein EXA21_10935 [Vibrio cincinnatiensis]|nr:hypothetical protein [Vibrio cincinnatiensis]MCG3737189.1 hypothetical protein [Vibrio cincinnatiensis]MCG3746344.1 hypothetical protein [Vibrio cincinnatiensis]MCG3760088.1 hypothetical protein [Vibrio cincinnatiensis]MCG3763375.1 hypothetical protein [Vibrio cincinnatiensis]
MSIERKVSGQNEERDENNRKKDRGIAGGTIPRVSMTPSLAAGVIWTVSYHLWNSIGRGKPR